MESPKVPREVVESLRIREPTPLRATVDLSFYKKQAIIRFPTVFNPEMGWEKGDKLELTFIKGEPPEIKCRLIRSISPRE